MEGHFVKWVVYKCLASSLELDGWKLCSSSSSLPLWPPDLSKKIFIYLFVCVPVCVFSGSVMSNSLRPQELWPAKLLCPGDFYQQEYQSGLPFPPPGDLPDPMNEPMSLAFPALASRFFTTGSPGNPLFGCLLSCDMGVLVPWPEIKPGHPASGAQSLSPWTTSEVHMSPDLDHDVYSHFRHMGWGLHYSPPNHFHEVFISRSPPLSHNCPIIPAWQPLRDKTVTREERMCLEQQLSSHIPEWKPQKWACLFKHLSGCVICRAEEIQQSFQAISGTPATYFTHHDGRPRCHSSKTRYLFPSSAFPPNTSVEQEFAFRGKHHLMGIKVCCLFSYANKNLLWGKRKRKHLKSRTHVNDSLKVSARNDVLWNPGRKEPRTWEISVTGWTFPLKLKIASFLREHLLL